VAQKPGKTPLIERLHGGLEQLRASYDFMVELVRESGLLDLAELYEDLKNCTEELTWVLNKAGKRYYYYYLKCKGRRPRSIYVGKSPEGYNQLRRAAALAHELKARVEALQVAIRELERAVEELRANAAMVESALSRLKR
jgi:hypothetical protein